MRGSVWKKLWSLIAPEDGPCTVTSVAELKETAQVTPPTNIIYIPNFKNTSTSLDVFSSLIDVLLLSLRTVGGTVGTDSKQESRNN